MQISLIMANKCNFFTLNLHLIIPEELMGYQDNGVKTVP